MVVMTLAVMDSVVVVVEEGAVLVTVVVVVVAVVVVRVTSYEGVLAFAADGIAVLVTAVVVYCPWFF